MKNSLVDLTTKDSELDSIILEEYPKEIYQGQHNRKGDRKKRTYCFYDLDLKTLLKFLVQRGYNFSLSGNVIKIE